MENVRCIIFIRQFEALEERRIKIDVLKRLVEILIRIDLCFAKQSRTTTIVSRDGNRNNKTTNESLSEK